VDVVHLLKPELAASLADLMRSVKAQGLEGLIAKRRDRTRPMIATKSMGKIVKLGAYARNLNETTNTKMVWRK
jgi:hypothetical protein